MKKVLKKVSSSLECESIINPVKWFGGRFAKDISAYEPRGKTT